MSAANSEQLHRSTLRIYGNLMEQFNPGLQKLASLGRSYVEAFQALTVTSEAYFSALAKMGEQALHSMSSRSLGDVIIQISECQRRLTSELEGVFCWFHAEVVQEMGANVKLDTDYISETGGPRRNRSSSYTVAHARSWKGRRTRSSSDSIGVLTETGRKTAVEGTGECGQLRHLGEAISKSQIPELDSSLVNCRLFFYPRQPRPPPAGPFLQTGREEERHWAGREGQPPERAPSRGERTEDVTGGVSVVGVSMGVTVVGVSVVGVSMGVTGGVSVVGVSVGVTGGVSVVGVGVSVGVTQGWFPAAYVGPLAESTGESGCSTTLRSSHSVGDLLDQPDDTLRPAGQQNGVPPPAPPLPRPTSTGLAEQRPTTPTPARRVEADTDNKRSKDQGPRPELFPRGTNPFATVKLRPTATNDRSAPRI
uniref:BAR/IMD domain containing adaptor protein 2 like 2b n=1 Tax=Lepisosteus oculatus TaxID=7918 RepID=W5N0C2_LEPOC